MILKKNTKGMTLISLVITIIVLIILAGVSINLILGQDGIIVKAQNMEETTSIVIIKEEVELLLLEYQLNTTGNESEKNAIQFIKEKGENTEYKIKLIDKTEEYHADQTTYLLDCSKILSNSIGKGTKYQNNQYLIENDIGTIYILSYYNNNNEKIELLSFDLDGTINNNTNTTINYQTGMLLDVARSYYTVEEIKEYITMLANNSNNSFLQMHLSDDKNVGIECEYLDQTKENAVVNGNVYTNPLTGEKFLTFDQVEEIMKYAKNKGVTIIPEVDIPAHMTGFFNLARHKFGDDFVNNIARGTGSEAGHIDIVQPEADTFIKSIYNEYTEFFKECKYFHMGFDEYTYRTDEKIDYANNIYEYLQEKGFIVRMWNDGITKNNIEKLNKNIEVCYWDYFGSGYATVPDLQENGFKVILTNSYYLFFVPSLANTNEHDLNYTVNDIKNNWTLERWDRNVDRGLDNYNNILGSFICVWSENADEVQNDIIFNQAKRMYNMMLKKIRE